MLKLTLANRLSDIPQFAAFRHRDFRNTWLANLFSGAAQWMTIVASGWIVFETSESSAWVGIVTFASMLPLLLASPVGGLLGDIYDRRSLAAAMFAFSSVIVAVLAVLVLTGAVQLWHVAVLAFAGGIARAVKEPALSALIPNQVPPEDLLNALVLTGATRHGARFFGTLAALPLLAGMSVGVEVMGRRVGLSVGAMGVNGVLVLSAVMYALGALQMTRVRTVSSGATEPERGVIRNMVDGLSYIYTHHTIALFVVLVAFHCALVMSFESILPVFSRDSLGADGAGVFNQLVMGFGSGALLGMLALLGVRDERRKGQLLMVTGLLSGVSPILLALSGTVPLAVLSAGAMGASQATFMAITNMYVQTLAPDRLRARISSLYLLHAGGIMAFANLGYGFLADVFTAPLILLTTSAVFIAVVVSTGAGQPILRRVYSTGLVQPA